MAANKMAGGHRMAFGVVCYGNVVGFRGSIVPLLNKRLAEGLIGIHFFSVAGAPGQSPVKRRFHAVSFTTRF
jgi:Polysaccharide biosynthesis protein